ncbi:MAG: hypothetical protein HUU47_11220 [Bacteroidetes bacterium]|nr:hypothetical protein [Bacteroidota bacterium]
MKTLYFIGLFLLIAVAIQCCKDEPTDPCKNAKPVSADFTIYETPSGGGWEGWYDGYYTDTILHSATFKAKEDGAKYTWLIGAGVYDKQSVFLNFNGVANYESIPVTCIVEKEPNKNCFPNDDGKDTFTKNVTVAHQNPNIFGTFQAKDLDDPNKLWTFSIFDTVVGTSNYIRFDNIPVGIPRDVILNKDKFIQGYKVIVIRARVYQSGGGGRNEGFTLRYIWIGGNQFDCTYEWKIYNSKSELQSTKTYNFKATKIK